MEVNNLKNKYYKIKLCNYYEKYGKCTKGDKCTYAHGKESLKKRVFASFDKHAFNKKKTWMTTKEREEC